MLKNAQTYIVVTVIALLVWVLAEAESVRVVTRQIEVMLVSDPGGTRAVRVKPGQDFDGRVTIELEGPAARIDEVVAAMPRPLSLTPDLLGLPSGDGNIEADLRAAIGRHPVFTDTGVRPGQVRPAALPVVFDDLVVRELRVAPPQPDGLDLEGVPEVVPPRVSVRLPARLAETIDADAVAQAAVDPAVLSRLPRGRPQSITGVRVELPASLKSGPFAEFVRAEPPTVSLNLTRRSDTAATLVASVPVRLQIAPIDQPQWDIVVAPDSIADVTVTGPRDVVGQIEARRVQVFAVVPLTWAELEAASTGTGAIAKEAVFLLSAEAAGSLRFEAADKSVRITVMKRAIVGPPPPRDGD